MKDTKRNKKTGSPHLRCVKYPDKWECEHRGKKYFGRTKEKAYVKCIFGIEC